MARTCLRAVCVGPRQVELQSVEITAPAPGWVVVRVRNCGICGSDLHFFRGDFPAPRVALGHEMSGEVFQVGEQVEAFTVGDRVVVEPLVVCQGCAYCRRGDRQLCPERKLMGTAVDGGLAEYIAVPEYSLHRLPDAVPFDVGALAEPLAVCVHGLRLAGLRPSDSVLILGAGAIGLLSIVVARELGASRVAVTARHKHQAELALELGASEVLPADATEAQHAAEPFDVALETVGGEAETLSTALSAVRPGGCIGVLGVFTRPVTLHPLQLLLKEVRIVGSLTYAHPEGGSDFDYSLAILERRWRDLALLVTSRFSLEDAASAFEQAATKGQRDIKVTVEPGSTTK